MNVTVLGWGEGEEGLLCYALALFAAKHVNKVLRTVPNMKVLNKNGVAGHYHDHQFVDSIHS